MKNFISLISLLIAALEFFACSEDNNATMAPLRENVLFPETFVEDGILYVNVGEVYVYRDTVFKTRFTDTLQMTSFIYQKGKNLYDTVRVKAEKAECNIQKDYFECTIKESHNLISPRYIATGYPIVTLDERCFTTLKPDGSQYDKCRHIRDTIFVDSVLEIFNETTLIQINSINYGKGRLSNYIPYTEVPKFSVEDLRNAFDTLDTKDSIDFGRRFISKGYSISSDDLPEWARASSNKYNISADTLIVEINGKLDTTIIFKAEKICLEACTTYTTYPKELVTYENRLWNWLKEPLESDTTITWTARFTDINGLVDSVKVTTLFLGK